MKKNFYKEYEKNKKTREKYQENTSIIIEKKSFFSKLFHLFYTLIHTLIRIVIFVLYILLKTSEDQNIC